MRGNPAKIPLILSFSRREQDHRCFDIHCLAVSLFAEARWLTAILTDNLGGAYTYGARIAR